MDKNFQLHQTQSFENPEYQKCLTILGSIKDLDGSSENNVKKAKETLEEYSRLLHELEQVNFQIYFDNPNKRYELISLIGNISPNVAGYWDIPQILDIRNRWKEHVIDKITDHIENNNDQYNVNVLSEKQDIACDQESYAKGLVTILSYLTPNEEKISEYRKLAERAWMKMDTLDILNFYVRPELKSVLDDLCDNGSVEFKEYMNNFLNKHISYPGGFSQSLMDKDNKSGISRLVHLKFKSIIENEFNIEDSDFFENWNIKNTWQHTKNLEVMRSLESKMKGSVKKLHEQYNINEFDRYPNSILLDQLQNEDNDMPYGLVIYPHDDFNQAFRQDKDKLDSIYEKMKGKHLIRIYEASSKIDTARILIKSKQKYNNKISFLILGGHGTEEGLTLGKTLEDNSNSANQILKEDLTQNNIAKITDYFVEKPTVVLISCSTGAERGFAEKIHNLSPDIEVFAPKEPAFLSELDVLYSDKGRPNFEAKFELTLENSNMRELLDKYPDLDVTRKFSK